MYGMSNQKKSLTKTFNSFLGCDNNCICGLICCWIIVFQFLSGMRQICISIKKVINENFSFNSFLGCDFNNYGPCATVSGLTTFNSFLGCDYITGERSESRGNPLSIPFWDATQFGEGQNSQ